MDWFTVIGVVASVLAAIGVGVQLAWSWRTRPTVELQAQPARQALGREMLYARNVGSSPARGVVAKGFNCEVGSVTPATGHLDSGEMMSLVIEDATDDAWVLFIWHHPNGHSTEQTWFPVRAGTAMEEEHRVQTMLSWWKRRAMRRSRRMIAAPGASLRASLPRSPRKLERLNRRASRQAERLQSRS
ncbi:hypothetical protein [Microbacterium galbinum]|uniref:Uncharacterized protein n=1 Tax=Microbacterium galbinum TaxID=2851646 RepID=A0ABY4IKC6_9MICO|nr:hypothetical protein [Microbacterium galbinum]UPL13049.1 hypothetical protein KV396_00430 [Microbacterium galbinum]